MITPDFLGSPAHARAMTENWSHNLYNYYLIIKSKLTYVDYSQVVPLLYSSELSTVTAAACACM